MDAVYFEDDNVTREISSRKAFGRLTPVRRAIDLDISKGDYRGLLGTVGLYVLSQSLFLVLNYMFRIRMEIIGQKVMLRLRKRLFGHILKSSVSFFDRNPVGRLMARVESDTEALRQLFTNTVVTFVGALLLIVGMLFWMFVVAPKLALVVAIFLPPILVAIYAFHRYSTPKWLEIRKRMADITATLTEFLHGMQIIQIFDRAEWARARLDETNRRKWLPEVKAEVSVVILFNFIFMIEAIIISLVLYAGARWAGAEPVTIGTLVMFIGYIRMLFEPMHMMAEEIAVVQKAIAGAKRIFNLLATDDRISEPARPVVWPTLSEGITFEDVTFSYTNDGSYAVKDLNFTIPKGRRFALAGVTGGGKSTVINLLLRFYDPQKGRILVDGVDIRSIAKDELRHKIGLVLQDIYLFPGTVATNVALSANGSDRDRIAEACRTVSADRFVSRMKKGLDTKLSERGSNLSRGERQLLSFARALYFDPQILVLDEATSSVDPETERLVQRGIDLLMKGRTSIIIAHRLSTILHVDQILVIREGEIIERGKHAELLDRGGYYAKLFKLQFQSNGTAGVKKAC
jgi:ATP-binding cassette subfamily B multidrug efflux pump